MAQVVISDSTLRDGSHAVRHQIGAEQIAAYCRAADLARVPIVEVGHGNGLGASSLQLGQSLLSDRAMLGIAREHLRHSKLGVFLIPGFGTIRRDLAPALDAGADVVRVGAHCTEADTTAAHLAFAREQGREACGSLMMCHMASPQRLVQEALKMQSYGAQGVVLMDSAGTLLPEDVTDRVRPLVEALAIPVGFHAHNNLGMAIANSGAALAAGARIIDATSRGIGAGAGNAQLEVLVPVLHRLNHSTGIELYPLLDLADLAERTLIADAPRIRTSGIVSGLAGVVSAFAGHVEAAATQFGIDPRDVYFELGRRKAVAGQEDLIISVSSELAARQRLTA